ncbi:unnamed protein product [Taenia asiatica]|uniref:Coproporphyrinogen III oxidase n=1 Tax=Taenia asiatica TaxID=60517 RepID=A0A0R3WFE6_TAEAS|nr:unnamed protein product [Taenia asiatica]
MGDSTRKQDGISIIGYGGRLSEKEIEQMLEDVEKFKQEMRRRRKIIRWIDTENQVTKKGYEQIYKKYESRCALIMGTANMSL